MDFQTLVNRYQNLRTNLQSAIAAGNERDITLYRGRLIATISALTSNNMKQNLSGAEMTHLQNELVTERANHRTQINQRINANHHNQDFSISAEVALKIRKVATSINAIRTARDKSERAAAIANTVGNSVSTIFSLSKYALRPAGFIVQRVGGVASYLVGTCVGLPIGLLGGVINPGDDLYATVSRIARATGGAFRQVTENAIGAINETIIRM